MSMARMSRRKATSSTAHARTALTPHSDRARSRSRSHAPARPRRATQTRSTALTPRCRARAAHVTRSLAQCSTGIAARAAIGRMRRDPEKSTSAGKEPEEHQSHPAFEQAAATIPIGLGHEQRRTHPLSDFIQSTHTRAQRFTYPPIRTLLYFS